MESSIEENNEESYADDQCIDTQSNPPSNESLPDITAVSISSDQFDTTYYMGEDAEISARFENCSNVRHVTWMRQTGNRYQAIDTTLPKYKGTIQETFDHLLVLMIRSCDKSDVGKYFLKVSCSNLEICSNGIFLQVVKGSPKVTLEEEDEKVPALKNASVKLEATIRGFPRYNRVIWTKDDQKLDITDPKYKESNNNACSAVLCINNVKNEDAGTYTIEVQNKLGKGQSRLELVVIEGVTLNEVPPLHLHESVDLKANIIDVSKWHSVSWIKHNQDIDSPHPKYEIFFYPSGSAVFRINNVKKDDAGIYTIEVQNKYGKRQSTRKLEVMGGVTLKQVSQAYLKECVKIIAKIEGFTKYPIVNWKKDDKNIDLTDTKYEGSKHDGDSAVLCIMDVKENDEGTYTIEVSSDLEKVKRSQKLVVIKESQMIFITGPVVAEPLETITFHAFLPNQKMSNIKWWKIKDQSKIRVETVSGKYFLKSKGDDIYILEIFNAEKEDSAAYQCTADSMKSNTINVRVDDSDEFSTSGQGNVIRFYAIQAVSAKAMRRAINNLPNTFGENIKKVKKHWAREFLSINTINSPEDLDISKMYMMYRNLYPNCRKWGKTPEKNEINEADDIERIRYYRNYVCHSDASEIKTAEFNPRMLDLLGAIRRISKDDHKMIKECCVILNRVFTTVEFINTMETFEKEPEKLGQHILNKEEEEMKTLEKEPEKMGQRILNKEEEEMKILEKEPEKMGQHILNKEEEEMKTLEKEPEKLGQHILNKEEEEMKTQEKEPEKMGQRILNKEEEEMKTTEKEPEQMGQRILNTEEDEMKTLEKEPENLGQHLLSEDVMHFIKFMLVIICSLIFPVALVYVFDLNN